MNEAVCAICGTSGAVASYTVRESMLGLGDPFLYYQCGACGCLQISSIPADLSRYYPSTYYSFSPTSRDSEAGGVVRAFRKMRTRSAVLAGGLPERIMRLLFPAPKLASLLRLGLTLESRILDIGCGAGMRLYALAEAGFDSLLGIDPFLEKDIQYPNGLRVEKKGLADMSGEWDALMFHHSFEHMPDQLDTLIAAWRLLRPGGTCLLRVPTVSSVAWERYREHWYQIDAPRHYFLHSRQSIGLLADQAGFIVEAVVYDSTADQFMRSEANVRGIDTVGPVGRIQRWRWRREARQLNREGRGDQACFYLRKTCASTASS